MSKIDLEYTKFKLSNGVKCVLYPRDEIHSVSIRVIINTGSLDEEEKQNGISHFIEHVVHDGTEELKTWDAVDDYTNEYSGSTNAFTSIDHTQYYGMFPYQYLKQALFYFSQVVVKPLFKESDVNKERIIILDELQRYDDEIDTEIMKNIKSARFENNNNPFVTEIIGKKDLLEKYTVQDLKKFYNKTYVPENTEIYIVGNMDIESAKSHLEEYFGETIYNSEKSKPNREFKTNFPEYSKFKVSARKKKDINQYYLTFTFPGPEFNVTDIETRLKVGFLKSITASSQYFQSILWKRLREELGIVYGVGAWTYDMYSRMVYTIQTSFDSKHLETILKEMYIGINKIKSGDLTDSVFKANKKRIIDTQLMQIDNPERALNWITMYEDEMEEHGRALSLSEYLEFMQKTEFEEIIELANEIYNWDNLNIGIVSKQNPSEIEEKVSKIWEELVKVRLI